MAHDTANYMEFNFKKLFSSNQPKRSAGGSLMRVGAMFFTVAGLLFIVGNPHQAHAVGVHINTYYDSFNNRICPDVLISYATTTSFKTGNAVVRSFGIESLDQVHFGSPSDSERIPNYPSSFGGGNDDGPDSCVDVAGIPDGDWNSWWGEFSGNIQVRAWSRFSAVSGVITVYDDPVIDFTPRWVNLYPVSGTTTLSTSVLLGADFYNSDGQILRISLMNYDTGFQYVPFDIPISSSGYVSVGTTTVLQSGFYNATYQVIGSSTPSGLLPRTQSFVVVSSNWSSGIGYIPSLESASSTSAICSDDSVASSSPFVRPFLNFGCWVLIPSPDSLNNFQSLVPLVQSKIPFVYFYDARDIVLSVSTSTASTTIGTIQYNFLGSTTTVFSISSAKTFLPGSVWEFLRMVVGYILWVEFLYYVYRRVVGLLPQTNK